MGKMTLGSSKTANIQRSSANPGPSPDLVQYVEKETIREVPVEHHHHHTKHVNVTLETIKTRDSRARKYAKLLFETSLKIQQKSNEKLNARCDLLSNKIKELELRKPEEKQVVTIEKHNTETIKEIHTKLDKRLLVAIVIATLVNGLIVLLK